MQIVIDIDDMAYKFVKDTSFVEDENTMFKQTNVDRKKTLLLFDILNAIKNGILLPKGHGFEIIKDGEIIEAEPCDDVPDTNVGELISRQAMLEVQTKYAEHMGATKYWQMRDDIRTLPSVEPERKFIEKVFETLREMDDAVNVICNLDVDAVLDRMEVDG